MTEVPGAREVREEDSFDVARVAQWLRSHAATPEGLEGEPDAAHRLLRKLADSVVEYLNAKIRAGCDAVLLCRNPAPKEKP